MTIAKIFPRRQYRGCVNVDYVAALEADYRALRKAAQRALDLCDDPEHPPTEVRHLATALATTRPLAEDV